MDPDELPSVWVEGKWADEVQWSSLDDRYHWFFPADIDPIIPSRMLDPSPSDDNIGHWVCYKTLWYEDPGYVGSLSINVGEAQEVPGTGQGLDLAGNQLDPDPSTIHPPLTRDFNSRSMLSSVESPYSYSWGDPPEYSLIHTLLTHGEVYHNNNPNLLLRDFRVAIDPALGEYEAYCSFCGNCPWQHGFWFYSWDYTSKSDWTGQFLITIIRPDGSYSTAPPLNSYNGTHHGPSLLSESGDHYWLIVNKFQMGDNPETPEAEDGWRWFYIYCVSRDALLLIDSAEIVQGGMFDAGGPNYTSVVSMEFIDDLTVLVIYWVATGNVPGTGYYADAVFTVPDPNESRAGERSLSCNSTTASAPCPEDNHVLSIQLSANPVTGSAALNFSTPVTGHATVQVFDITGRTVETLVNDEVEAGSHLVNWTPENISSGVYFIRLTTPAGIVSTQAMVLR